MVVKYFGENEEMKKMADKLNEAMSRGRIVSPSWDKKHWIECKGCGEKFKGVFADNGLCTSCDEKLK